MRARWAKGLTLFLALLGAAAGRAQERDASPLAFTLLPDLLDPLGFGGPLAGTHGEALIVAGGANFPTPLVDGGAKVWHDRIFVLLPGADTWRNEQTLPRPLAYSACASTPKGVVVVGGSDAEAVYGDAFLMAWDSAEQRVVFEDLPELPTLSAFGSAEALGSVVYVFGGKSTKSETDLAGGFWKLDLDRLELGWVALPEHPGPARLKMVTAVQDDPEGEACIYLFSGSQTSTSPEGDPRFEMFTDAYRYSPEAGSWTVLADLPVLEDPRDLAGEEAFSAERWPINAACAAPFGKSEILTFSGSTGRYILDEQGKVRDPRVRPAFANRVLAYDVIADRWRDAGEMPVGVVTTRAVQWQGQLVVASGEVKPGIRTPRVQALSLVQETLSDEALSANFRTLDYVVLSLYLALMLGVGAYFARRGTSAEDFFLAGRKIPWWAAGLSVFGTQLSAITFMAVPATAYGSDWRRFVGSLMLLPVIVLVIYCFVPLFRRLEVTTAYEYLEARFSLAVRVLSSAIFILFQLGRMGIVLLLPAIALSAVTGIDTYLCIGLMGLLATAYTAMGGIAAVIWTDVLQVFVLIGGALLCLVVTVADTGGLGAVIETAQAADKLHIFDWRWSTTDMVAWVLIVGFAFTNLVPYTTDQTVIQRYLTTRDEKQAAKSMWLNLAMTIPTGLLFYGLGTALWVYYMAHPAEQALLPEKVDQLVPWFVVTHLPAGVAGVVVAGIFAAAMSSLDSSMNSISAAVVNDFVVRLGDERHPQDLLLFARRLTCFLGFLGTGAAMVLATYEIRYLFDFFQKIMGLFGGGLAGVFLLAVFSRTVNAAGALAGLVTGSAATLVIVFFTATNFLLYAAVGTCTCVAVGYLVSCSTGGETRNLAGLTLATLKDPVDAPH